MKEATAKLWEKLNTPSFTDSEQEKILKTIF